MGLPKCLRPAWRTTELISFGDCCLLLPVPEGFCQQKLRFSQLWRDENQRARNGKTCSIFSMQSYLGWRFETFFYCSIQLGIVIPTDFHIFQRGRYTTTQDMIWVCLEIGDLKLRWLIICVMFSMKKLFGPFGCRPHCQRIHISSQNWKKQFAGC
jgi:hypothetical protein